jgi:diguanylate cyclase (GGDEF)-like protein
MNFLYYAQTLSIGIAIDGIILFFLLRATKVWDREQRLFILLVLCNMVLLLLELALNSLTGMSYPGLRPILIAVVTLFYIFNPVAGALWLHFVISARRAARPLSLLSRFLVWLPAFCNAVLSAVSIGTGTLFYISEGNVYTRGPWFLFMAGICYGYLLAAMVTVAAQRSRYRKQDFRPLLLFHLPMFAGALLQTVVYRLSLVWTAMALCLLIVYLNIQNELVSRDPLTGLANRRQMERYLSSAIRHRDRRAVGGLLLDLDDFKTINDTYGHDAGDKALESAASILHDLNIPESLSARYGGDEFIILLRTQKECNKCLEKIRERIMRRFDEFNTRNILPFAVQVSIGTSIYNEKSAQPTLDFFKKMDEQMYAVKQGRQAAGSPNP